MISVECTQGLHAPVCTGCTCTCHAKGDAYPLDQFDAKAENDLASDYRGD
jgi:hypothetical protein